MNISDMFGLKGKTALVTGGEGRYGRQIVTALAGAGARVFIASPFVEELQIVADGLNGQGCDVIASYVDQGDEESILKLRDRIICDAGSVDILVNNAIVRPMKSWQDSACRFDESMHVNAAGIFVFTRAFGDVMAARGSGSIINICSIQGMVAPDPTLYEGLQMDGFVPDYFFHKGGLINFTRFTASYYGRSNVRCNSICPGGILSEGLDATFVRRYSDRTFLGRMANGTDLMGAVVFFASDASVYVTGANLPVDGGYTAK